MSNENWRFDDQENGLSVVIKPLAHGRCSLEFALDDLAVCICSTRKAFLTAALGAKSHFASSEGACEFVRRGNKVRLKVQQWRGSSAVAELDGHDFETALNELEEPETLPSREIRLL